MAGVRTINYPLSPSTPSLLCRGVPALRGVPGAARGVTAVKRRSLVAAAPAELRPGVAFTR